MFLAGALSMAMGTANFGLFIKPMGDELGIGRATFGWAQTARQAASALTSPLMGGIIDRYGARILLAFAAAVSGVAVLMLSFVTQGWQLVALFAVMGVAGMSGPGALVTSVPVAQWFVRSRAKAMSIVAIGVSLGAVIFIPVSQILIETVGWRDAWRILALCGGGLIVPLSLILVRRNPEDMGLLPDGARDPSELPAGSPAASRVAVAQERSWTRAEAIRSPSFWRLVFVFSVVMLALSSVFVHRIPHFVDRGIDRNLVAFANAAEAGLSAVSVFAMGALAGRIHVRFLGAVCFLLLAWAILLTILAHSNGMMIAAMLFFGSGAGGMMMLQNYMWADYFGRAHLGSIRGVVMPVTLLFGGIGPPAAGYIRDATGTYTSFWTMGMVLLLVGAMVLVSTPPPRSEPRRAAIEPLEAASEPVT
jgi:MFS family permease